MIFGYEYEPENSDRGTFAYCPLWHGISLEASAGPQGAADRDRLGRCAGRLVADAQARRADHQPDPVGVKVSASFAGGGGMR